MIIDLDKYSIPDAFIKNNQKWIYDNIRKLNVHLTPEETVRQKVISFLLEEIKAPVNMLHVEALLSYYGIQSNRRADIIVLKKDKEKGIPIPLTVIECKAPQAELSGEAFEQVLDYAYPLACDYIILTNGTETIAAAWDFEKELYRDIKCVPLYEKMLSNLHQWADE